MTITRSAAQARAGQDWRDGIASDQNPYACGTLAADSWQEEMDRIQLEEMCRDLAAHC